MLASVFLFFESISGGEMILIFLVILMLFGSKSIPDIARTLGKASRQFKDATGAIQRDIENGTRDFKTHVERETHGISQHFDPDKLAGSSTPPPATPPTDTPLIQPTNPDALVEAPAPTIDTVQTLKEDRPSV